MLPCKHGPRPGSSDPSSSLVWRCVIVTALSVYRAAQTSTYALQTRWALHVFILKLFSQTRDRYEKALEDVSAYTPRYMEEMEAIFEQAQEEERKRISFLKQVFLSIHRHLDVTNNER